MKVLVAGATGQVGRDVAGRLASAGHDVRGLVRETSDPETVSSLNMAGVKTVVGDLRDAASIRAACEGCDVVVSTATALGSRQDGDSLEAIDGAGQVGLIDAAAAAGARRFVLVSVLGLEANAPFASAKIAAEQHLAAASLDHVIVQPSIFMDTWFSPMVGFDWANGAATIYGDGTAPMAWVSAADVAETVAGVVDNDAVANTTVPVLGPELLSPAQVVGVFEQVAGRSIKQSNVPAEALEGQRAGSDDPTEQSFASLMLRYAAGDPASVSMPAGVPHPQTTVEQFAQTLVNGAG